MMAGLSIWELLFVAWLANGLVVRWRRRVR